MKRILLAISLWVLSFGLASAQSTISTPAYCNKYFQVSQAAVASTTVVAGVANQSIQLCGWAVSAGAATGTATLTYGTGTNCGTSTGTAQPIRSLAINSGFVDHVPFVNQVLPVANDLCLTTTGTGPTSIIIYYAQF